MRCHSMLAFSCVAFAISTGLAGSSAAARPQIDVVSAAPVAASAATSVERLQQDPELRRIGTPSSVDARFGVPTFVWATRGPTAVQGVVRAAGRRGQEQAARTHLGRVAPLYGLQAADLAGAELREVHDTGRGGVIASFHQRVNGIEVFRDEVRVLMDRDLELLAVSGFIPGARAAIRGGQGTFRLDGARAVGLALEDFAGTATGVRRAGPAEGGYETFDATQAHTPSGPLALRDPIRTKPVWFHRPDGLEPAHYVEVLGGTESHSYVISAVTGGILFRNDLTNDSFTYRVWADGTSLQAPFDGPQGNDPTPHPTGLPDFFAPPFVSPSLRTLQNGPISTNDPWLPAGSTQTVGNNVDAYADLVAPDGFGAGDLRGGTTSPGVFDWTYNPTLAPGASTTQRNASVVQLFYTNNYLHDWFYDAGFNELSRNAQASNYGRGGAQNDVLRAEAQDYSGTNNANMSTPADGVSPRMQMYVFNAPGLAEITLTPGGAQVVGTASFGPQAFDITAAVVLAVDGTAPTSDACQALVNAVAGKIVLLDRGTCTFVSKAAFAQSAGAVGVIVANNVAGSTPPALGGTDGSITIPVLSITLDAGNALKASLGGGPVTARMRRVPEVARDGTLDNQIVAHEWGHYISNRLIGNANGLTTNQARSMGEGWGDFHAMMLTVQPDDALVPSNPNFNGVYGVAGYATGSSVGASNSYYFGIRRLPYSTDFARNALTFRHIQNGNPLPVGPPTSSGADGSNNAQVHNSGEVWCTMLWECYAELLRDTGRLTFEQARARMRDYLVAAYKMTPITPTFVEARDAMLAAALAADVTDYSAFWQAFARRGIGVGAVAPDRFSTDHFGVVESFAVGGDLAIVSASLSDDVHSCDSDGYLDEGEIGNLFVTVQNTGAVVLNATTVTLSSSNPAVVFPSTAQVNIPRTNPGQSATGSVQVLLQGAAGLQALDFQISANDPGLLVAGPRVAPFSVGGHADEIPSATETVEALVPTWTMTGNPSLADEPWRRVALSPTNHAFFAPDPVSASDQSLVSPPLQVAGTGAFSFTFWHSHAFETTGFVYFDGGVLELSTDGGATWNDIGLSASPTYIGSIDNSTGNPLAGRPAFVNRNPSYPAMDQVSVNLGTAYQGQTVRVRFRLGADASVGDAGWHVDNLQFSNLTHQPFLDAVAEPDVCSLVSVDTARPAKLALSIAGASPILGTARVRFALPSAGRVDLTIHDVSGRRVARLAGGDFAAGEHTAVWNARAGAAGVYFARLSAGGRQLTERLIVLP